MIELRKLALRRGRTELFADATMTLTRGSRVGVVGRNGCGKSSLLAVFTGELQPDDGELEFPSDLVLAHVAQHAPSGTRAALEIVLDGDQELRAIEARLEDAENRHDGHAIALAHSALEDIDGYAAPARASAILLGLGFTQEELALPADHFSGGWRMRLNLARALIARSDILLLDEPTNHLDLDAVLWLESWLRGYEGTLLVISHDRDFLDRITSHIVHIESARAQLYTGDFSAFEQQRADALVQNRALYERQQKRINHLQGFVDRFRAKATKARQAQSRLKTLERMERIELAHVDRPFRFSIREPAKLPSPLLRLEDVAAGYDGRVVIDKVRANLVPGARVGLVGHNGAGKSTLIKLIAGEISPMDGVRETSRGLSVGYFAQHQLEQLDPREGPLTHMRRVAPNEHAQQLRDYLGGFGFPGEMADAPCANFSGGEKARLVLATILWSAPNMLLLDEPTNHLDLDMRDALTSALQAYAGALVTVSHDRHLLDATTDELWLVHDGEVRDFRGDLDDYRNWLLNTDRVVEESATAATPKVKSNGSGETAAARKARKQAEAEARKRKQPLQAQADKLERKIGQLGEQLNDVESKLAAPEIYDDANKSDLQALLQQQASLRGTIDACEAQWMDVLEELDAM